MGSRLLWRRSATAVGLYTAMALGIVGTVIAARGFSLAEFGLYATVLAAAGFFQSLLDLTVEDSLTKYGFRYVVAEDWGRLRRLFRRALELKLAGGVLAGVGLLALAPLAEWIFGAEGLALPLVVAAALPLVQAPENVATTALLLRGRYDLRALSQSFSMGLRLLAIAIGVQFGVAATIAGIVLAQVVGTVVVAGAGIKAFRRFPEAPAAALHEDRRAIVSFVLQSSVATGMVSLRNALAPLLLGITSGPTQVGLFRIAQTPQTGFNAASGPVRLILLTEQTRDWERGRTERVLAGVRRYTLIAFVLGLVLVPLFFWLMPHLIELVFGVRYLPATDAARIILFAAAIQLTVGWAKSLPVSIGRPELRLLTAGIETALLLPLVVVLGLRWGATGAAVALLVSSLVYALTWAFLYLRISRDPGPLPRTTEALARE
ncbi:MAG TPA: lipopolysaccharide biosynthesis protein [Gaiellaceae bacterium]|nr:lipopolysaccharide biosynthesis protein [Gaiellaceae bacterium]